MTEKDKDDKPAPTEKAPVANKLTDSKKPGGEEKLEKLKLPVAKVVVHPLVLLSVVDHFNRVSKTSKVKRVVGVLLGSWKLGKILDVSNSFAVPFDEDEKDKNVWFLDHDYLEIMYAMFKKVNAREKIVGWYHTGPKLNNNDIKINDLIKKYVQHSVLVIVDVQPKELGLPTEAYVEVEEVHDDGTPPVKTFEHVPSEMGAEEAEEVGVEHLLRDIKDQTAGTLSQRITDKLMGSRGLQVSLANIQNYLKQVSAGQLPINHSIIYLLQDILNLIPDLAAFDYIRSTNVQLNDQMMTIYLGSLVRSVVALHNLINNKISLREAEKGENTLVAGGDKTEKTKKDEAGDKKKEEATSTSKKATEKKE